jgi:hypothetical protein
MDIVKMIQLARSMDNAQEYLMLVAKNHGEITLTFKNEIPFVTIFLGKGPEAKIGFGNSVAGAIANALEIVESTLFTQ